MKNRTPSLSPETTDFFPPESDMHVSGISSAYPQSPLLLPVLPHLREKDSLHHRRPRHRIPFLRKAIPGPPRSLQLLMSYLGHFCNHDLPMPIWAKFGQTLIFNKNHAILSFVASLQKPRSYGACRRFPALRERQQRHPPDLFVTR